MHHKLPPLVILGGSLRDAFRRPAATFIILGLVPGLWSEIWHRIIRTASAHHYTFGRGLSSFAEHLAITVCIVALAGGQIAVALEIVRGRPPRVGALFSGPGLLTAFIASLVIAAIAELAPLARAADHKNVLHSLVYLATAAWTTYVFCRLVLWVPLAVDKKVSLWEACSTSIQATRGNVLHIMRLVVLIGMLAIGAVLAFSRWPLLLFGLGVMANPVVVILFARVYVTLSQPEEQAIEPERRA